jgi:murein DD-endopeptidase MepM/ murein hydrolase activator NlpD
VFQTHFYRQRPKKPMFKKGRHLKLRFIALPLAALLFGAGAAYIIDGGEKAPLVIVSEQTAPVINAAPVAFNPDRANQDSLRSAFRPDQPSAQNDLPLNQDQTEKSASQDDESAKERLSGFIGTFGKTERKIKVDKGDTLMEILTEKASLTPSEATEAVKALKNIYDPRDLNPKHEITVTMSDGSGRAIVEGIKIEKDILNTVTLDRTSDGFKAASEEKSVEMVVSGAKGTINGSLYGAAKAKGVPESVIASVIKVLAHSVDFQRDIQAGDHFEIMFEQAVTEDGNVLKSRGELLFARLKINGEWISMYRFEDADGDVAFYDHKGNSTRKSLLRTPIDGARISSGFGMRTHPVLGYSKMHKGVDFAAPSGTPIFAAGDGVIEYLGRFSSYGNYVRIRHRDGYKTAYAHLKGFKSGLRNGTRVKQGDVIGYVGSTGRSTGPHLHYEVIVNGKQVNPKSIKLPSGSNLAGADLKKFKRSVDKLHDQFAALGPVKAARLAQNEAEEASVQ